MFVPDCFGQHGFEPSKCIKCMVDVNCFASKVTKDPIVETSRLEEVVPRYSRADAAKRVVLNACFKRQRSIMDLSTAYGLKYQRARTYINHAKELIDRLLPFTVRDNGMKVFTTSDGRQLVRAARSLFLDDRSRNFYLAETGSIMKPFEEGASLIERECDFDHPVNCSTVITNAERVHEFTKWKRVKVILAFGTSNKPVPTSFFGTGRDGSIELWTFPLAPYYIGIWRR